MDRSRFASAMATVALAEILLPSLLHAQITFQRTYGGAGRGTGYSVQQTRDGGYIVAGQITRLTTVWPGFTLGSEWPDVLLIKTSAHGDTQWTRTYGGVRYDIAKSAQQTADGGYIVAGQTNSFGAGESDIYLIRTDAHGDTLWTRALGGADDEVGNCVRQTSDGGYILVGSAGFVPPGSGHHVVFHLTKTDACGRVLWTRNYTDPNHADGKSVQQTDDGGYVVAGYAWGPTCAGFDDVYIVKTDSVGHVLWTRMIGGGGWDIGNCVQQTTDGGFIVAGQTQSFGADKATKAYLIKTDASGQTAWTRTYAEMNLSGAHAVRQTSDGGYVLSGSTYTRPNGSRVCLIKTNANGEPEWTRTFTMSGYGYSVQQTRDGGYVVAGETGQDQVFLMKTDVRGNIATAESQRK